MGILHINGCDYGIGTISDFTCDLDSFYDEHRNEVFKFSGIDESTLTYKVKFNERAFYKLTGLFYWVCNNCPNHKVAHLAKYGRTRKARKKNFKRALHIIGVILDKYSKFEPSECAYFR